MAVAGQGGVVKNDYRKIYFFITKKVKCSFTTIKDVFTVRKVKFSLSVITQGPTILIQITILHKS